jgi:methylated-DNA-[protein]-cysteine S-methyltransferase
MMLAIDSPVGVLILKSNGSAITGVEYAGRRKPRGADAPDSLLREAERQLARYFAGKPRKFDLPLAPAGSAFNLRAWKAMSEIPYGETRSYGDIAFDIGSGPRAIGGACGRNPIAIVIPCHRVLAAGGAIGGYSGGEGLATKRFLLGLEGAWPARESAAA